MFDRSQDILRLQDEGHIYHAVSVGEGPLQIKRLEYDRIYILIKVPTSAEKFDDASIKITNVDYY